MPTPNVYDPDALALALTHTHTCDMHDREIPAGEKSIKK